MELSARTRSENYFYFKLREKAGKALLNKLGKKVV